MSAKRPLAEAGGDDRGAVARGAGVGFAGNIADIALKYATQLVLSRLLGAPLFGVYVIAVGLSQLLELVAGLGLHTGGTRFAARELADGDSAGLLGTLLTAAAVPAIIGGGLGLVLAGLAPWLAGPVFGEPQLTGLFRIMALAVPIGGTVLTVAFVSTALRTAVPFVLIRAGVAAANLAIAGGLVAAGHGVRGAALGWLIANLLAAVLILVFAPGRVRRVVPRGTRPRFAPFPLLRFSAPLLAGDLLWLLFLWTDVLLLGALRETADAGIYRAAAQTALLLVVFRNSIGSLFGPRIAELHAAGEDARMAGLYVAATRWSCLLTAPVLAVVLAGRHDLMSLFGAEFTVGATALAILASGQMVNAATGNAWQVLVMTGHPWAKFAGDLALTIVNVVLNLLLIPRYGMAGAAAATAASIAGVHLLRVFQVWRTSGLLPYGPRIWRVAAAAAVAIGAGFGASALAGDLPALVRLVIIGASASAAWAAAVAAGGLEADDRMMLAAIGRKLRPAAGGDAPGEDGS